ncbi:NmrA-domain-containing protein [Zalerion maritima]|uniref:NmrA-domain-containing protein n=1 Tax=Zalerion maritima TaxID=339359 RepID=A0AAD5WRQ4_9PEZI|nr:NmrA-domain-containing protein [Zalerion maritima]
MHTQPIRSELAFRPIPSVPDDFQRRHKHSRSSHSEASPLVSRNNSLTFNRPAKRSMPTPDKTIAIINASGRQAASLIRVATAVGYHVRAQLRNLEGVIATEVATNPNVTILKDELYTRQPSDKSDITSGVVNPALGVNHGLIDKLFDGAQLAFINTTFYGNEIQIGEALANAAKKAGIQHYVYSSMPDHASYNKDWPSLPLWASKHHIEDYIRKIGLPATFLYTGIYNNNFTSLPYPLFCMELQKDGSFTWQAPFHPDAKLPWLDAEHDAGPSILQIFKDSVSKWGGRRIALAHEYLTPKEACEAFEKGVGRPVRYIEGPIEIKVNIPNGYREQLEALEKLFGMHKGDHKKQPPYFGDKELDANCVEQSWQVWEGPRGLEEYAQDIFPVEERANGLTWMEDGDEDEEDEGEQVEQANGNSNGHSNGTDGDVDSDYEDEDDGIVMRGKQRKEESWLA